MKILFLGSDIRFFKRLVDTVTSVYGEELSVQMSSKMFSNEDEFAHLVSEYSADFVLIDYDYIGSVYYEALKIVRRLHTCNDTQVGLVGSEEQFADLNRRYYESGIFIGMKGVDLSGLVFGVLSFINYPKIKVPSFVRAFYSEPINVRVPICVDTFSPHAINCNSGLSVSDKKELVLEFYDDKHRLKSGKYSVLKNGRAGARDFGNNMNLAIISALSTKKSSAREFITGLKAESKDWTIGPKTLDKIREVAVSAGERRKYGEGSVARLLQLLQYNWVLNSGEVNLGKNLLRCFALDSSRKLTYMDKGNMESDLFIFNNRDRFLDRVSLWKPSLIVINCESENEEEIVKNIINRVSQIVDYFPYLALFSTAVSSEQIRDDAEYHQIVCFPFPFKADVMSKVEGLFLERLSEKVLSRGEKRLKRYKRKFKGEDLTENHFNDKSILSRDRVVSFTPLDAELLGASEIEIFFRCESNIDIGTKLAFEFPFTLHAQVVDHIVDSKMATVPNCMRAIITLIKEDQLMILRQYVNSIVQVQNRLPDGISVQKLLELKKEYFTKIVS